MKRTIGFSRAIELDEIFGENNCILGEFWREISVKREPAFNFILNLYGISNCLNVWTPSIGLQKK